MEAFADYVKMLSYGAIAVGIVLAISQDSENSSLVKLICGIFLTITAVSPVARFRIPDCLDNVRDYREEAVVIVAQGEEIAQHAAEAIIKENIESYIMDKAASLQVELTADVVMADGIPETVRLEGNLTDEERETLAEAILQELGIPKENQQWIGCK